MCEKEELNVGDARERDRRLGRRLRWKWQSILDRAEEQGLTEAQIKGFVKGGGLTADDAGKRQLATSLGFDWEGAAEFFAAIMPLIEEMMAACSA